MMSPRLLLCSLALAVLGCKSSSNVEIRYHLTGTLKPGDVVRVETLVNVDAADKRGFDSDIAFRPVQTGVGYEVRDIDNSGHRTMRISFDKTLGYKFQPDFRFLLQPPLNEAAPKLQLTTTAFGDTTPISGVVVVPATFGASVDVALMDGRCGAASSCPPDQTCCGGCVNPASDVKNCGGCGNDCTKNMAGDGCTGGTCRCHGGSSCASNEQCCTVGCINVNSDPANCGSCGHRCPLGDTCDNGKCVCGAASCDSAGGLCCVSAGGALCMASGVCSCGGAACKTSEEACCGSSCTSLNSDNNCGSCGNVCGGGTHCGSGECLCNGVGTCSGNDKCCPSGCRNTDNDPANCGGCGQACNPNETCAGGACHCNGGAVCTGGRVCCGSAGCIDVMNDSQHCGGCDLPACAPGKICQQGACVDNSCTPSCANMNQCVGGACACNGGAACVGAMTCCPPSGGSAGGCVDLNTDIHNCKSCGRVCGGVAPVCGVTC